MIKFYYHPSPNPVKVAWLLEEIGLPYEVVPIDTRKGEQFSSEFIAINPNGKTPAIVDDGERVFDSTAILLYLTEKSGKFLPSGNRGELLSWKMFIASAWGWAQALPFILGDKAWSIVPHMKPWFDHISARPAAQRANALKDKFSFKTEIDDEASSHMFSHLAAK